MGHAACSRVVIDHLARSHDVQVVVSGRAHGYLKALERDRLGANKIWGLSIVYEDNEVQSGPCSRTSPARRSAAGLGT